MKNNGFLEVVCFGILIGAVSGYSNGKYYPYWFFHMGLKEATKESITSKLNNNITNNGSELSLLNSVILPIGSQHDCDNTRNLLRSPIPLVELGGNFYYFGTYFKANYFKATQFCREHGMNLLSIESSEENTQILNYLAANLNSVDHVWTSGSDLGEEGKFVWMATGKAFKYTYWSPPQPDNAGKIENCVEIWKLADKHYIWNDIPCTNQYNFICEVPDCSELCKNKFNCYY